MKKPAPKTASTEATKVLVSVGDCEISFESLGQGNFAAPATTHRNPKSEFIFEYNDAIMLTDKLTHRQYEDLANHQKITEIYIVRQKATNPFGKDTIQIPLLRIIAK